MPAWTYDSVFVGERAATYYEVYGEHPDEPGFCDEEMWVLDEDGTCIEDYEDPVVGWVNQPCHTWEERCRGD